MSDRSPSLARLARRLGGTRVLALPILRTLAVIAGCVWWLLAPPEYRGWTPLGAAVAAFAAYSGALMAALWRWPGRVLRWNLTILVADLGFALALIALSGGVDSTLFLALLLIAGLQAYYYGLARGMVVAAAASAAYLAVVGPGIAQHDVANLAIRLVVLLGTALGVGLLAQVEEGERLAVLRLTGEVQEREEFIRGVVEHLSEGAVALDQDGRVAAWNRAMEQRYHIPAAEVMGRRFLECFPSYRDEGVAEPLERLLRGEVERITLEAVEHDTLRSGRAVQHLKGSLLRRHGRPAGAVLLIEDVTERLGLERSARRAEKLAALGTMAAGLAHELNNPIGIISSRIEIMLQDAETQPLPLEALDDLRVLHRHTQRLTRITQGLLSFARQSSGQRGPVDLNHLVEETLLLVERPMAKAGIAVKRVLAPEVPPVLGDANALQQVVLNLVTNARDALRDHGEVCVETQAPADTPGAARLLVRDTGPGIPPEALPRIFDPFFTTKAEGTGLGLSISYGIVREHQASIDVESRAGAGTTFILTFPPFGSATAAAGGSGAPA